MLTWTFHALLMVLKLVGIFAVTMVLMVLFILNRWWPFHQASITPSERRFFEEYFRKENERRQKRDPNQN